MTWSRDGGPQQQSDYLCEEGHGELALLRSEPVSFALSAEGLDASGVARVESFGQTASFGEGVRFAPIEITLRPKSGNVVVMWNGCPPQVILPYFITVYEPGSGAELGAKVSEVQESCQSGMATVERVPPGDYVVEVDSRAVTPAVRGTADVTVVAGEDAEVMVPVP